MVIHNLKLSYCKIAQLLKIGMYWSWKIYIWVLKDFNISFVPTGVNTSLHQSLEQIRDIFAFIVQ